MTHPLETAKLRRTSLTTTANPRTGLDYVVTISGCVTSKGWTEPIRVTVRYVPDDLILGPDVLRSYLKQTASLERTTLEDLCATMAGDLDAELLPRWIRLSLTTLDAGQEHRIDIEQTKPGWDNRMLLARLKLE